MEFEILTTERLLLRVIHPEQFNYIFKNYSEEQIKKQLDCTTDAEFAKEKARFEQGASCFNRSRVLFQMRDKLSNEIIGSCGYVLWYVEHQRAEIGYAIKKESFKGKGLMTETVKAVLDYGFGHMQLNRVEAFVSETNLPSLRLMEKFNFTYEGLVRQHYMYEGKILDSKLFSLLKNEYPS